MHAFLFSYLLRIPSPALLLFLVFSCSEKLGPTNSSASGPTPADYVDPFIGTGGEIGIGHGNVFPGACYPFGMIQLSPDNGREGWEYASGYHYPDGMIAGFSHTHLSGTGVGDLADISLMPTSKSIDVKYFEQDEAYIKHYLEENDLKPSDIAGDGPFKRNFLLKYRSRFSHESESAEPGYYYVHLSDDDIDAELTVTEFMGMHRYTFNKTSADQHLIVDLGFHINRDRPIETAFEMLDSVTVVGYRFSTGWAHTQKVFFALQFSRPVQRVEAFLGDGSFDKRAAKGEKIKGVFTFDQRHGNTLIVKTAISSASIEGALANLATAIHYGWNFEAVKTDAKRKWNEELQKILISDPDETKKTAFYTSLYRCFTAPYRFSDVNGYYKGYNHEPVLARGYTHYTVLSLWDTFRALKPLFAILQPALYENIIHSMLSQYEQTGSLPYWEIVGNEGGSMIGYHAVSLIADAILKNIGIYDLEQAYQAMVDISETDRKGLGFYRQYHYVPTDLDKSGTVSKTVEYSYNDWCIAQIAQRLDKTEDYENYMKRSEYYRNVYDPQYKLMRGKNSDGSWYEPFHPRYATFGNPHCVEGNTWQYSFFAPQNIPGLIELMGGKDDFDMMLDSLFTQTSALLGVDTEDVTGMIGQYAHGNEPSHHVAYLYDFIDQPTKAQFYTNKIMDSLYQNTPEGLCGNEDCGQMSAWYVFSSLGFYPVNPIDGRYYFGSPQFEKAEIALSNEKVFTVLAPNVSDQNIYIKSVRLNGKELRRYYITYDELLAGGVLEFNMTNLSGTSVH